MAKALDRGLGLVTVGDLLSHYPRRYASRGELTDLGRLPLDETVTIVAEVLGASKRKMRERRGEILEVTIGDGKGIMTLTFFGKGAYLPEKDLIPGVRGIFAGKVSSYNNRRQLTHPDYKLFDPDQGLDAAAWAQRPIPIYPATASLKTWKLHDAVCALLDTLPPLEDPVPDAVRIKRGLLPYQEALNLIHRPNEEADWRSARKTLRFQEAFVLQSALLQQRAELRKQAATPRVPKPGGLLERFDAQLPFTLTGDQRAVGEQLASDLAGDEPMNRLLQGEVGSGKTLVALRAMLAVADSGGQSALLAPTEVLAAQHLRSIVKTLGPDLAAEVHPTLITGQLPTADRRKATLSTVAGQARIVVGTHALMSQSVEFFDLGLVVVDEQHRFGVEQREALRLKGATPPHVLVLTATPIPRTVAMTVFGDLDVSTIAELPAGRQGIESFVVPLAEKPGWENRIWERLSEELAKGRQAFVVAPAIDSSNVELDDPDAEPIDAKSVSSVADTLAMLRKHPLLASARIEPLHGRLPSDEKDAIMRAFAAGDIDVLVATTVIEVGVDVPNAAVMVVLDADRFGVSQLHQLRGRVGRGGVPGLCLLVTTAEAGTIARERVDAVAETLDGFVLAQKDLELRQEGNVLGSVQSGRRSSLKLLRAARDTDLIGEARALAADVLASDPDLQRNPTLARAITTRLDEAERDFLAKA
ncbi:ATP-dependent DNA helicase RecG [Cryobacterium sp. BB736]|uniref:ATP-dependent DNA helicase RecG n=1 Tax=Cryobacterium sp. BB736 TaxID=2746963 RepID=UPI001876F165|nr:ATP-dependent DNA helicase RecG [Cryobacterium sp. BB736]